jgi:hypothetical protein
VLSGCTLPLPDLSQFDGLKIPQVVTLKQTTGDTYEQVSYEELPAYQAWQAGYQVAPDRPAVMANRFDQIDDYQRLAEYQAYIAGFQEVPETQ